MYGSLRRGRNRIEYSTQPVDEISIEEVTEALDAVAAMLEQATTLLPNLGLFGGS